MSLKSDKLAVGFSILSTVTVVYPVRQKRPVLTVSKTQGFLSETCQCMLTVRLDF